MNRSSCASGSGYVPSDSIGFCVASTRNGRGSLYVSPAIVTWRPCMTSSTAHWTVRGGEGGRDLRAPDAPAEHVGERLDGQRLGESRHALEQHVAAGEQRDE